MRKLFECVRNDILINMRNGLILGTIVITFLLCWFDFFFLMPKERVLGDALTLSSWATQIFIIAGTIFGFVVAMAENGSIQELFYTLENSLCLKRISKIILACIMSLILACICVANCILGLKRLFAADIYYLESAKYLLLYWILPFLITAIGGEIIADNIKGKIKYAFAVLQMLMFGPLLPTIIEPLIDVSTNLYKYVAMFSIGTLNVSKSMNLMFGYDLQREKVQAGIMILFSFAVFFLGASRNKTQRSIVRIMAVIFFLGGITVNMNYIEGKYDYYAALDEYEIYQNNFNEINDIFLSYDISQEQLFVENGKQLSICAEMTVDTYAESNSITFVLYHGFEIDNIKIDDCDAKYERNADVVTIAGEFKKDAIYNITLTYIGNPPTHMYISETEWILPSYIAWYPIKGNQNSISFGYDLFEPYFYNYQQDDADFRIMYSGNGTIYCSLDEQDSFSWKGASDGITLLCSKWMKKTVLDNGTSVVYPSVCTNYDEYLEAYINEYLSISDLIVGWDDGTETAGSDLQCVFFTCDSTYTGHGERIYNFSNHAIIEITRAYLDGSYLSNPNLSVYPLIEFAQFGDAEFAIDANTLFLYKTVCITTMVNAGELEEAYLIRTLEDLENLYENVEGNNDFYNVICLIEDFFKNTSFDEQHKFVSLFRDLIKSGSKLTVENIGKIMEDSYDRN